MNKVSQNQSMLRQTQYPCANVFVRVMLCLFAVFIISACGSTAVSQKTSSFTYAINASDNINPDINGRPSSVVIRVYQLKNRVNFDNARYEDLFNPVNNTLGAEFIAVDEFLIDPGMNKELDVDVSAATKFVGIAVGYRSDDSVNWRTIVTMPEKAMLDPIGLFSGGGIQIILDELSVRAEDL